MLARTFERLSTATLVTALLILAASATGCGGGSGGGGGVIAPPGLQASFTPSGTAAAADAIAMTGSAVGDLVTVEVRIGGPTTSADLYSFAFDLTLGDPSVAEYVPGTATAGTALTPGGGQSLQVLAVQQGDRVTVGVTKLGGGPGNGVGGPGEASIVELVFRLLQPGLTTLTLEGSPGSAPTALDSTGGSVGSVTFDPASATLFGV